MRILLRNGNKLRCEPKAGYVQEADNYETLLFFIRNAWYFYHHRERIYADSKLFLARVPLVIHNEGIFFYFTDREERPAAKGVDPMDASVTYTATLGGMLEFWENNPQAVREIDGQYCLLYLRNALPVYQYFIGPDSTAKDSLLDYNLFSSNDKLQHRNYHNARKRAKCLTLMQVKDLLVRETGADSLDKMALEYEQQKFLIRDLKTKVRYHSGLEKSYFRAEERYLGELCYLKRDEWMPKFEEQKALEAKFAAEIQRKRAALHALKRELKRTGDVDVQREYQRLMQEKKRFENEGFPPIWVCQGGINMSVNEVARIACKYAKSEMEILERMMDGKNAVDFLNNMDL